MSKRLSISQPTVIDTELTPLNDNFWLETNGSTEQWYYENDGTFSPNRETTPLIIKPHVSAVDYSTQTEYTPTIYTVKWVVVKKVGNSYREQEITTTDTSQPYYRGVDNPAQGRYQSTWLFVRDNNPDVANAIMIRCEVVYLDPRDVGRTYTVRNELTLTTSRDAQAQNPTISIFSPSTTTYNPLISQSSQFTLIAQADWSGIPYEQGETDPRGQFVWYGINENGQETNVMSLPFYVSGQNTNTLVVDALYGENIQIVLRIKRHASDATLLPPKQFANITWKTSPLDCIIVCENGNAIRRNDNTPYFFHTIVNANSTVISEDVCKAHLIFNWKRRRATPRAVASQTQVVDTVVDAGCGYRIPINASLLVNTGTNSNASSLVYNEVYLRGAYEKVTINNEDITYNNESVYARN